MEKHFEKILRKQCEIIGVNYDSIDFGKSVWFMKYEWTEEQEQEMKEWFINLLRTDKEVRENITLFPEIISEEWLEDEWNEWNLNYGWKNKAT